LHIDPQNGTIQPLIGKRRETEGSTEKMKVPLGKIFNHERFYKKVLVET